MNIPEERFALLHTLSGGFPTPLSVAWTGQNLDVSIDHALFGEFTAFAVGDVCSLPFLRRDRVHWVTFGSDAPTFRDAMDTLRAWLMPTHASEEMQAVVSTASGEGRLSADLLALSKNGYFRWQCRTSNLQDVVRKLRQIRALESRRPARSAIRVPTLLELRGRYNAAYLTGNWPAAEEAVKQIDALQLDTALNTTQMKIRIWGARAEFERIVQDVERSRLLGLKMSNSVREIVLQAYANTALVSLEETGRVADAARVYRNDLHLKLGASIVELRSTSSKTLQRLTAYRAWADDDFDVLFGPGIEGGDNVVNYLRQQCPPREPRSIAVTSGVERPTKWPDVVTIVKSDRLGFLEEFLERNAAIAELRRPGEPEACATALLELFFDDEISVDPARRKARDRILMQVVDTTLCDAEFPIRSFEKLYQELLELWVLEYGDSSYAPYGQLVLSVGEGLLTISSRNEGFVVDQVRAWWVARPANSRLGWLLEAIDLLSMNIQVTTEIDALWSVGAELIRRDPSVVRSGEFRLWRQLGSRLRIASESVNEYLPVDAGQLDVDDPLAHVGLRRIAIVTLQERAGRVARDQLIERTNAEVFVVASTVADGATAAAAEADLVLFVWSATKHAVLRAFDGVRDKLQFVQGTGPASIVLAAERWAASHKPH